MPGRRRMLGRRLVDRAVNVVSDRAPGLSEKAYRAVAAPLHWVDPEGGARSAEARLDHLRDRVATMAARGRAPRSEHRRIQRDLARTREDLERLTPRLPAVRARSLERRLTAYTEAVQALPVGSADDRSRAVRARDAAAVGVASTGAWIGVLTPTAGSIALQGGIAAGAATTLGVTAVRNRRARKERMSALTKALSTADEAIQRPGGMSVGDLDGARRSLTRRALASGRLDPRGADALRDIDSHLDDLLVRLVESDLDADVAYLVTATVSRYLPDTLEPFLALGDPQALVRGRPAEAEVADQLTAIEGALAAARQQPGRNHPEMRLLLQGEFLRDKFGEPQP